MGLLDRDWFWEERRKREGLPSNNSQHGKVGKRAQKISSDEKQKLENIPPAQAILAAKRELSSKKRKRNYLEIILIITLIAISGTLFLKI